MKTGDDIMWFYYDSQGNRVGVNRKGLAYYYLYNLQGDVVGIVRATTGKLVATYKYDAWGNCTVNSAEVFGIGEDNPFRYRGYYYDAETGLYYLNSRYYSLEICRFINPDTADILDVQSDLHDKNLYAYCDNNPVVRVDLNGEIWVNVAIGAVIGGISSGISTYFVEKNIWKAFLSAGFGAVSGALTAVSPGAATLIDVGLGVLEERTVNFIWNESPSNFEKELTVSMTVDTVSGFGSTENKVIRDTARTYESAKAKTKAGNHPDVKKRANKVVNTTRKPLIKETGKSAVGSSIGKTIVGHIKNFLKKLF